MSMCLARRRLGRQVTRVNTRVARHFGNRSICLIYVLGKSVFFAARLTGQVTLPVAVSFVSTSDCKTRARSSNIMGVGGSLRRSVRKRGIVIIRSVISSKGALDQLVRLFRDHGPGALAVYALLSGPSHQIMRGLRISCAKFIVPSGFMIKFNLSCSRECHGLPCVKFIRSTSWGGRDDALGAGGEPQFKKFNICTVLVLLIVVL